MFTVANLNYEDKFNEIFKHLLMLEPFKTVQFPVAEIVSMRGKQSFYYNPTLNLTAGQYLILLEQTKSQDNVLDKYIKQYQQWIVQENFELDSLFFSQQLASSSTFKNETIKLRMLNTGFINKLKAEGKVTDNLKDAKNRQNIVTQLTSLYYDILKNSKIFKSPTKYIEQLPKLNVDSYIQYLMYINRTTFKNLISHSDNYNEFIYSLLFAFIGQIRAEKILNNCFNVFCGNNGNSLMTGEEASKSERNKLSAISSLSELEEFHQLSSKFHKGFDTLINQKDLHYETFKANLSNNNKLRFKYNCRRKRTVFMIESIRNGKYRSSSELEKFSSLNIYNKWLKKIGVQNGEINALTMLENLHLLAFKSSPEKNRDCEIILGEDFAENQILANYFNIDITASLNMVTLTVEDLEVFTETFTLTHNFSSNWFKWNLSLVGDELLNNEINAHHVGDCQNYEDIQYFKKDRDTIVNALIQFSLVKYIQLFAEKQATYVQNEIIQSFTTDIDLQGENERLRRESEKQENEINDLKQQLRQAQLSLHNKDLAHTNEIQTYKEQVSDMKEQLEMNKELDMAELENEGITIRELSDQEGEDSGVHEDVDYIEMIKELNIAVIGGHNNLHTNIRNTLPNKNLILITPRNYTTPIKVINKADVIVYIDSHNNHGQFRRVMAHLRKNDSKYKMFYSNTQPQPKVLAKAVYEHFMYTNNSKTV